MTTDILDLPGWTVLNKRLDAQEYELEAEYTVNPTVCQKCGAFEPASLFVHLTPAVVPGEHRKPMLLCQNYHRRFHTDELSGHDSGSTH